MRFLAGCFAGFVFVLLFMWLSVALIFGPQYDCRTTDGSSFQSKHWLMPFCIWREP